MFYDHHSGFLILSHVHIFPLQVCWSMLQFRCLNLMLGRVWLLHFPDCFVKHIYIHIITCIHIYIYTFSCFAEITSLVCLYIDHSRKFLMLGSNHSCLVNPPAQPWLNTSTDWFEGDITCALAFINPNRCVHTVQFTAETCRNHFRESKQSSEFWVGSILILAVESTSL